MAARNGNRIVVYIAGMTEPGTKVRLRVVGSSPKSTAVSSQIFVPGNTSNTAASVPMTLNNNTYSYQSNLPGYEFDLNTQSQYTIQRFVFDVN